MVAVSGQGFHESSTSIPLSASPVDCEYINFADASSTKIGRWNVYGHQFFITALRIVALALCIVALALCIVALAFYIIASALFIVALALYVTALAIE